MGNWTKGLASSGLFPGRMPMVLPPPLLAPPHGGPPPPPPPPPPTPPAHPPPPLLRHPGLLGGTLAGTDDRDMDFHRLFPIISPKAISANQLVLNPLRAYTARGG